MKKTLIRALSFCMILALLTGLMAPFASAIDYEGVEPITLEAAAGLLIDLDTDQVLYEQNADGQRYPASITKIMTALLTLEAVGRGELDLSTVVTVDAAALKDLTSDSSTANLKAGEEITVHDLLYCLMLASANEAANILAMTVCGDIPTFVERMNQRAQELGMTGTHFMNPHGLHNSEHYSTAWDIYRMAKEAMTHAAFREIVSTARYVVPATNLSGQRVLLNTNALLTSAKFPGYTFSGTIGIKTGSTGEAGYCLVAAAKKKGHTLVSVVLGADNPTGANGKVQRKQFAESKRLMTWGFESFSPATLLDAESYLKEIPVRFSTESTHVLVQPTQSVTAMVPGEYDASRLELRVKLKEDTATAPIEEGDVLGTITVIYGGEDYGTVDLAAVNSVSFSPFLAFVSSVNTVLKNIYVRLLILIALVMVAIGFVRRYRQRTKEERHQKRKEKQEAKIAFRQREAEARLKDEELAKQERAERERLRKEDLLRRQQEHQERQAKREQELLERQARHEEERKIREQERQVREEQRRKEQEQRAKERLQRQQERDERNRQREAQRQKEAAERRQRQEQERRQQEREAQRRREEQERRRQQQAAREARQREERRRREQADRERLRWEEWERRNRPQQRSGSSGQRSGSGPQRRSSYDRYPDDYRRNDHSGRSDRRR